MSINVQFLLALILFSLSFYNCAVQHRAIHMSAEYGLGLKQLGSISGNVSMSVWYNFQSTFSFAYQVH